MRGTCRASYTLWGCTFWCSRRGDHAGNHLTSIRNSPLGWIRGHWPNFLGMAA